MNIILPEFTEPVTADRYAADTWVNGNLTPGAITTISFLAVVMPLEPDEYKVRPEGMEDRAGIVLYTETELKSAKEVGQTKPDVVIWDGRRWQVLSAEYRYQLTDLNHWKVTALLEDIG